MKKIIGLLSLAVAITMLSCTEKPAKITKEVIVVPGTPVIIVKDPPAKGTTITFDKNGVKVETRKVEVGVKN